MNSGRFQFVTEKTLQLLKTQVRFLCLVSQLLDKVRRLAQLKKTTLFSNRMIERGYKRRGEPVYKSIDREKQLT